MAKKSTKSNPQQDADDPYYLPGERFTMQVFLRGRPFTLIFYFLGSFVFCFLLLTLVQWPRPALEIIQEYWLVMLMGLLTIYGNIAFWLYLSFQCRSLITDPKYEIVFHNKTEAEDLFINKNYRRRLPFIVSGFVIGLGLLTMYYLGINASGVTWYLMSAAGLLGFFYLGRSIGFVVSIWIFFYKLQGHELKIDPLNEDRMGGMKAIIDFNTTILYLSAILTAIYSYTSFITPYANPDLRSYAWSWTLGAIFLLNIALFWPTIRLYRILKQTKEKAQLDITILKHSVRRMCEDIWDKDPELNGDSINRTKVAIDSLRYYQEEIEKMQVIPYFALGKLVASLITIQAIIPVITNWEKIKTALTAVFGPATQ